MENGSGNLPLLLGGLRGADADVLVRVACGAGSRPVWHIDAVVGPPEFPSGWQPRLWEYEMASFVEAKVTSRHLAAALDPDDAQVLELGPFTVTLPVLDDYVTWWLKPSRARYDSVALPWPTMIFEVSRRDNESERTPSGYLIGDDCPSFFSYERAFRAFFYGEFAPVPGQSVPSHSAVIRVVRSRAWLDRIVIAPTHLDVLLRGSDASGVRVELNGATYRADARAGESGEVRIALPDGLPSGAWLYASRDRQWLDYRAIGDYSQADLRAAGIEVELPEDPQNVIETLLTAGEGPQVEFKSRLPDNTPEAKRKVFKTIAAFLNGGGGQLAFGIDPDETTICGLTDVDPLKERDRLFQLVRSVVTPPPVADVRLYEAEGKKVLVLSVESGPEPPYGITPGEKNKPPEFYIRRGASTFPARPEEIRAAVLATAPVSPGRPHWLYG